jgi:hypothetical protein
MEKQYALSAKCVAVGFVGALVILILLLTGVLS